MQCNVCRKKLNNIKQVSNMCKCEQVFCDNHKQPEVHKCEYNYKLKEQNLLKKKLQQIPIGHGSFQKM